MGELPGSAHRLEVFRRFHGALVISQVPIILSGCNTCQEVEPGKSESNG